MKSLLGAGALAGLLLGAPAAHAQTVLKFNSWLPPTHPIMAMTVMPWAEEVAKATEGRVKVEFTASSLGPPPNQFDLVKDGVADAAITVHGYTPARFPLMQAGELPFLSNLSEPLSVALWRVTQKHFAAKNEHAGTQVMAIFTSQPGRVFTVKRSLKSLADWEGLKLAGGAAINVEEAKALGAVGIRAPGPQAAEMTKRGTVDGLFIDMSSFADFNLGGTIKHMLDFQRGIHAATFTLMVNKAKWDAISPADRAAIEKISGETLSRTAGRNWDISAAKAREALKPAGVEVSMITPEHQKALEDKLRFLEDEWLKKAQAAGIDGKAVLADLRQTIAAYPAK
jgi:TRAP-type C4-dicarboxylate transport system substrate-binding protein